MLSIVVPTFNEAENLPLLVARIAAALDDVEYEIIIADDDSPDATAEVCEALSADHPIKLVLPDNRDRDLSLSVIDGVHAASFDKILVMDADLSHPPEMIPEMLRQLEPTVFVVGSRYVSGGSFDRDWSLWRFVNSHVATLLARPLSQCGDPMSGFFMFNREQVDLTRLKPIGYKIGLEIMVRGDFDKVAEVPILFTDREIGESKMNLKQQFNYLRHLRRLYLYKFGGLAEFIHFGVVGASGFVIDIAFYYSLQFLGVGHVLARGLSFWPAVSWNWALNRLTTFGERTKRPRARQWVEFVAASLFGFSVNWGIYSYLSTNIDFFIEYRLAALITGIICASFFNFAASTLFVYSDKRKR